MSIELNIILTGMSLKVRHCVKESKYVVFSRPYFPVFRLNTGKYGPERIPCLDTFHTLRVFF